MIKQCFATLILLLFVSSAWAHTCPVLMGEIDQALDDDAVVAQLDEDQLTQVRDLRQQGEEYHDAGDHAQSEAALNEAKDILAI